MQRWMHSSQKVKRSIQIFPFSQDNAHLREERILLDVFELCKGNLDGERAVFKVVVAIFLLCHDAQHPFSICRPQHCVHVIHNFYSLFSCSHFSPCVLIGVRKHSLFGLHEPLCEVLHSRFVDVADCFVLAVVVERQIAGHSAGQARKVLKVIENYSFTHEVIHDFVSVQRLPFVARFLYFC